MPSPYSFVRSRLRQINSPGRHLPPAASASRGISALACGLMALLFTLRAADAQLISSEWNTGSGAWNVTTNWDPNDVPDNGAGFTYDVQIGNRPVAASAFVTLVPEDGTSDTVTSLSISGGADLSTNGNALFVIGQTTLSGASSSVLVQPAAGGGIAFNTDNLDINASSALQMSGGTADIDVLLEVNAPGSIVGHGLVVVGDADAVIEVGLENSGLIVVGNSSNALLTLQTNGIDTLNLDGTIETGIVDVSNVLANTALDTLTLVVDGPLSDAFSGTLSVGQRDRVTFNDDFTMDGADVQFDGGTNLATMDGPGSVTSIANSVFTIAGSALISNNLAFTGAANTVTLAGGSTLTLGGTVTMPPLALDLSLSTAQLAITGSFTSTGLLDDFNWDGPGTASTTISGTGVMNLNVDQVDTGNDLYGGVLTLNDTAALSVNVTAGEWTVANELTKNNAGISVVSGDRINVTGVINVTAGTLDLPAVTTNASATISTAGILTFGGTSVLGGAQSIGGAGLLRMEGTSSVSGNTTIATGTFDWDGLGTGTSHTIADGVTFTINSPVLDTDGDMDDPVNLGGNGAGLIVSGPALWTQNGVFHSNNAAAGSATIGGTSAVRFTNTINVNGNTLVTTPVTFDGAACFADIDATMTLDLDSTVIYGQGLIDGAGTYDPGPSNTVTGDFTINADIFDIDAGNWVVESGARLVVNTGDYDNTLTNSFDTALSLNNGEVLMNTADPEFVMDGTLNLSASGTNGAEWTGDAIAIGNDSGTLDADLNVSGDGNPTSQGRFFTPVTFHSDADVNIGAGASLFLNSVVHFDTVNGPSSAEFTGPGSLAFSSFVNVNEAVTLAMPGGTVDLDGVDATGETVNIDAPLTIQAATLANFGRVNGGGGINILDINHNAGSGSLAVNLDAAAGKWTLNGPGVMNLVNDNAAATLLSGNPVVLNGTVNVTGDVRSTALLDIAGVVNINTPGEPFRLAGGTAANRNTIQGGTITGTGVLGAEDGRELAGFGTINNDLQFIGTASLWAKGGTLTLNGSIIEMLLLGTLDDTAVLDIPNPWETDGGPAGTLFGVFLQGGALQGAPVTNDGPEGISGHGLVASRVINSSVVTATAPGKPLIMLTGANDNDWDGSGNNGQLIAQGGILELRDNATFGFTGDVIATDGGTVFTSGFALDFNPASAIFLNNGTLHSTHSTDIAGPVTVSGATPSEIEVTNNFFLDFEATSAVTLNQNLTLRNNNILIRSGATFSGSGALSIPDGSSMVMYAGSNANVLLDLAGALRPANSAGIGQVTVKDLQQAATSELYMEITGTLLNQYDRVSVNGTAVIDGYLNLDINGGFVPVLGQTFNILSATGGVTGKFTAIESTDLPAGLAFKVNYLPTLVQVEVIAGSEFEEWIHLFTSLTNPADRLRTADPDGDGMNNLMEFAFDGDPTRGTNDGKVVSKIAPVGGVNALTLTFPVRYKNEANDSPGPEFRVIGLTDPILQYRVYATDTLATFPLVVGLVSGADATAIQAGLPPLSPGWSYSTCRSPGPVAGDPAEFMRIDISEGPLAP